MAKIDIFDMTGKVVGETELNDAIFGIEPNMSAVHTVVVNYLANQRQGTQSALTRAEVSGGGRKPWRQKGTGRARQGSIRAPQWHHGGVAFAPKPREYRYSINKKIRRLALKSVLSDKAAEGKIILVDSIQAEEYKTSVIAKFLKAIKAEGKIMSVATVKGIERFDANTDPHVHFVCSGCDAVIDLHQIPMPRYNPEECGGCHIESCSLTFTGICGSCQN